MSKNDVFPGQYFLVFGLIAGKYRPEKIPYLDTFHAVFFAEKSLKVVPLTSVEHGDLFDIFLELDFRMTLILIKAGNRNISPSITNMSSVAASHHEHI